MKLVKVNKYFIIRYIVILCVGFSLLCGSQIFAAIPAKKPMIVEVTGKVGSIVSAKLLVEICKQNGIPASSVYEWNNHVVVYGDLPDTTRFLKAVAAKYPTCIVKLYSYPFYNFDRKYCSSSATAKEWDNIILTVDLVADPKLQQEYLEHHRTQFEKWPEVSNGFCHANFQQLLVFKNGRQLMLVISIPKGESLDKLNPLTTKNNPRVDDWNKIMAKYQEGVAGTKKGETWVFLKNTNATN